MGTDGLNCGVKLGRSDVLDRYGIRVLGTAIDGIEMTEDRQLFKDAMGNCDVPVLTSGTVTT